MQYRSFDKLGLQISVLGFGAMRFPLLSKDPGDVDEARAIQLIRHAIDKGINYVDTAYNYHKGKSEALVGKALKDGYREKTYIATKMPVWLIHTYEDFDKYLNEQLQRLQVETIDFYLIHNLNKQYWNKLQPLDVLGFLDKAKKSGKIKYIGFSFHDDVDLFKEIIDAFQWDFCQIQYNYMNEKFQAGTEGLCYAAAKDIPVIVMEPLLGGKLAKVPPQDIKELWDTAKIKRTAAAWGLKWIFNKPEVKLVLSGMSNLKQLNENIKIASATPANSLSQEELELVKEVAEKYASKTVIGCTDCSYCMPCPNKVYIPYHIEIYNDYFTYDTVKYSKDMYKRLRKAKESAFECIECGKCEAACPQKLPIMKLLKDVHAVLG